MAEKTFRKRMLEAEPELAKLLAEWMETARRTDEAEDERQGKDRRGDEIPDHVKAKLKKLLNIRAAKVRLGAFHESWRRRGSRRRA